MSGSDSRTDFGRSNSLKDKNSCNLKILNGRWNESVHRQTKNKIMRILLVTTLINLRIKAHKQEKQIWILIFFPPYTNASIILPICWARIFIVVLFETAFLILTDAFFNCILHLAMFGTLWFFFSSAKKKNNYFHQV